MTARYGNAEKFLNTFKPDMQVMAARYTERAYFGTAPMLSCRVWCWRNILI